MKTDRPWNTTWPGDAEPTTRPIGTEVPPEMESMALEARVVPYPKPITAMTAEEAAAELDELTDYEVASAYCLCVKKAPGARAKRDTMIEEIVKSLAPEEAE